MKAALILIFSIFNLCISKIYAQSLSDSLLAHYPFDGNALDISGNNNHGSIFGPQPVNDRFGNSNSAYLFNGSSDYIHYNSNSKFKPNSFPISLSMWIKSNDNSLIGTMFKNDVVVDIYTGIWLQIHSSTGRIEISYGDGGTTDDTSRKTKLGNTNVNDNQWHFIAAVIRGPSDMDIWIDCQYDNGTYSGSGGPLTYSNNGGSSGYYDVVAGTEYYGGILDDIRFYNRELNQNDLALLYITPQPFVNPLIENFQLGNDTSLCGLSSINLNSNINFPGIQYNWSNGSNLSMINVNSQGLYWLEVSDNCNQKTDTILVNSSNLNITASNDTSLCIGQSITLSVTGNAINYIWSNNGMSFTGNTLTVSPTSSATYYVVGNGINCISNTDSVEINILNNASPSSFVFTNPICENSIVQFVNTSPAGINYSWNFGEPSSGNNNISSTYHGNHTYSISGNYTVSLLTQNACGVDSIEQTVIVLPTPVTITSADLTVCEGDQILISAQGGDTYQWSNNIISTNDSIILYPVQSITYYVNAILNGCVGNLDSINILVNPVPTVNITGDSVVCFGQQEQLIAVGNATNFTWSGATSSSNDTITISPISNQIYILNGSNQWCQSEPDTIEISVLTTPTAGFTVNGTICSNSPIQFFNNCTSSDFYSWNFGDANSLTNNSTLYEPFHTYENTGQYIVSLIAQNQCGFDTITQLINIGVGPSIDLGDDSIVCIGSVIQLLNPGVNNIQWSGSASGNSNSIIDTIYQNSIYIAQAYDGVCFGLPDTIIFNVTNIPNVNVIGTDLVCLGDSIELFATGASMFSWQGGIATNINSIEVTPESDTDYIITGYIGACSQTDTFHVDVLENSKAIFSYQIDSCLGILKLVNNSIGGINYNWKYSGQESELQNPIFQIKESQTEESVELIVNPNTNCADTSIIFIESNLILNNNLFIPNTFTPNKDQLNDYFEIKSGKSCGPISIHIFNRWGESIFKMNSDKIIWDGKFKNSEVPQGVYFYILEYNGANRSGTITIFR